MENIDNKNTVDQSVSILLETAKEYLNAGLCVLPANKKSKCPTLSWKKYQNQIITTTEFEENYKPSIDAIAIVCGNVSGNLEVIDFDNQGEMLNQFLDLLASKNPDLKSKLVIELTQSGGFHIYYRCEQKVSGNLKLAMRDNKVLIETRGEGGLIICAPTDGYKAIQGNLLEISIIEYQERNLLLNIAKSLDETPKEDVHKKVKNAIESKVYELLPSEDYQNRGDPRPILVEFGWHCIKQGINEHWCRPNKETGLSATLKNNIFYVFSSNSAPFESERGYSAFSVYSLLKCNGNYKLATKELYECGYGKRKTSSFIDSNRNLPEPESIPEHLLTVPGFIGELSTYMLESASYPNKVLSFIGAIAMQSFLCGKLIKSESGLRPNLYLLGLASSGSGKDHSRKVNAELLEKTNMLHCLGDSFASAEGLEDRLAKNSCLLYQTDEIDNFLHSIKHVNNETRFSQLMAILLKIYTSSDSSLPRRALANTDYQAPIKYPHLTIFGTTIPKNYYEALSEKMLTNGFFARMLVFESYQRSFKNHSPKFGLPDSVLEVAKYWCNQKQNNDNFNTLNIQPKIIYSNMQAKDLTESFCNFTDNEYKKCEKKSDEIGMTVWSRASENMVKLAMLYAVSKNHQNPIIEEDAVKWASELIQCLVKKMLFMADKYSTDSKSEKEAVRLLEMVPKDQSGIPRWKLLKKSKLSKKEFDLIIETLVDRGDLVEIEISSTTNRGLVFKLPKFI